MSRDAEGQVSLASVATRAFHTYACGKLRGAPRRVTQLQVAEMVGASESTYCNYLRGRGARFEKIFEWVARWNASQKDNLVVQTDGTRVWLSNVAGWGESRVVGNNNENGS